MKNEKTKKIMKVSFYPPPPNASSSKASTEVKKRWHWKNNWDVNFEKQKVDRLKHHHESWKHSFTSVTSSMSELRSHYPPHNKSILIRMSGVRKIHKYKPMKLQLSDLQTVKKNCEAVLEYRSDQIVDKSKKNDGTVFSYIAKLINKVKSQMKAHSVGPKDPINIVRYLSTFTSACDTDLTRKVIAMLVQPHYVKTKLENKLDSCLFATHQSSTITAIVRNIDNRSGTL